MAIGSATGASQGPGGFEAFQRLRAQAQQKIAEDAGGARKNPAPPVDKPPDAFAAAKARTLQAAGLHASAAARPAASPEAAGIAATLLSANGAPKTYQKNGAINAGENRPRLGQYVDFVA